MYQKICHTETQLTEKKTLTIKSWVNLSGNIQAAAMVKMVSALDL